MTIDIFEVAEKLFVERDVVVNEFPRPVGAASPINIGPSGAARTGYRDPDKHWNSVRGELVRDRLDVFDTRFVGEVVTLSNSYDETSAG